MGAVGDCVRACTASVLDLPIDSVPHFVADQPGDEWYDTWEAFMRSKGRPITIITIPWEKPPVPMGYYLASGPSPRGVKHMVVMRDGAVAHDPHPSRAGLSEVEVVWVLGRS